MAKKHMKAHSPLPAVMEMLVKTITRKHYRSIRTATVEKSDCTTDQRRTETESLSIAIESVRQQRPWKTSWNFTKREHAAVIPLLHAVENMVEMVSG